MLLIEEDGFEDVYDLTNPITHNFFINDILVHNCSEQMLANGSICVLGSINLTQFVNGNRTEFDLEKIKKYTQYLIRFLDNVDTYSDAPLPEYIYSMRNKRRIGAGLMGWGSSLMMLKIKFGSEEALSLQKKLLNTFTLSGVGASLDLAVEKGMFSLCEPEKHVLSPYWNNIDLPDNLRNRMKKNGIRNSSLFSDQPTGNTGVEANIVSGGIEPVFLPEYIRTVIVSNIPEHIKLVTPNWYVGEWHETEMFKFATEGDEQILRGIDDFGTIYKIDKSRGLTKEVLCQDYGVRFLNKLGEWDPDATWAVTTTQLSVADHINDLSGWCKAADSSVSKTINLPNDYSFEKFQNVYIDAYKTGYIKGCTTYRTGTMSSVLSAADQKDDISDEEIILDDVKLPDTTVAEMKVLRDHESGGTRKWYVTVGLNANKAPISIFVQTNAMEKSVTTNDAVDRIINLARLKGIPTKYIESTIRKCGNDSNSVKIARSIGLLLRHGVRIKNIVSELDKVEGVGFTSFLFHIKKMLSTYIRDGEKVEGEKCTQCGGQLIYESGCYHCASCGNSKCS
jgi:ribonucleoside-diphosphate reductase alpha chain